MDPLLDHYPRITSFSNLCVAAQRAQLGKRYRPDVLVFNSRLEAELFRLHGELRAFTYQPGPNRVVHHALCATIVPPLKQRFIRTSVANRRAGPA